ncbi:MAG: Flp family type IVb pilin [Acidimicrobiales bacterium]
MGVISYVHRRALLCVSEISSRGERGAALVEYALLLALIVVFCILAVTFLGDTAAEKFSDIGQSVAAT